MARAGTTPDSLLVATRRFARVMPVMVLLILIFASQSVMRGLYPQVLNACPGKNATRKGIDKTIVGATALYGWSLALKT